jgi:hypothetical protein
MSTQLFEVGMYYWAFILLSLTSIVLFIKFLTLKNEIKRAGVNYYKEEAVKKKRKNIYIVFIILFTLGILYLIIISIILKYWYFFILSFLLIMSILPFGLIEKRFKNINGIYENGIIYHYKEYFEWKKIHSYSINENNLSGYLKNGFSFVFLNIGNIDEIEELFKLNKIKYR